MSHALYSTALLWHVTRGVAKLHGVLAAVGEPLMLMGRRVAEIDYIPEIGRRSILFAGEPLRDMTGDEVRAADALLIELTQ
ncbi:MAG: hypothetical protein QG592_25 [Pseudomonadota bacterium]|jgi:hypothetical protein|nr:hypothetical protein [Pseudomonadota bacterium]